MNTGICKNCGGEIYRYPVKYYGTGVTQDQIPWLHSDNQSTGEDGTWCRVTQAEPLEE